MLITVHRPGHSRHLARVCHHGPVRWPWDRDLSTVRRKAEDELSLWAGVVAEVERGYSGGIHDYTLDLELHSVLSARVSALPAEDPLHRQLAALDERFAAVTRPVVADAVRGEEEIRVPVEATGELLADLRARGWT